MEKLKNTASIQAKQFHRSTGQNVKTPQNPVLMHKLFDLVSDNLEEINVFLHK